MFENERIDMFSAHHTTPSHGIDADLRQYFQNHEPPATLTVVRSFRGSPGHMTPLPVQVICTPFRCSRGTTLHDS